MPRDLPDAPDLIAIVAEFLDSLRPFLSGYGAFQVRIAANLLRIAEREVREGGVLGEAERARLQELLGHGGTREELEAELVSRIRGDDLDAWREPLLRHLRASAEARLRIANPKYVAAGKGASPVGQR